jgi:AraC family transcriptional regulator of adaptative response / DNA-3-methyladenine glycosylase II
MPRLASAAADRIALGALNTQPVASLASDLCVSERHLRRAVKRELGVTPTELAQTHRLLMAKRLLADTKLDMSRIAFASGFQSLRRFNAVVRERYGMAPTALRRATRSRPASRRGEADRGPTGGPVELTLAYRPPLAWSAMLEHLAEHATPGVERVDGRSYARTVRIEDRTGVVVMQDDASRSEIRVRIPPALVPALMPLLAALRRLLDLDAEPSVIDARLAESGLGAHVEGCRGLRVPGAVDGFEHAVLAIVHDAAPGGHGRELAAALVRDLGGPVEHGEHGLDRIAPDAARLAEEGESKLTALGLPARHAKAVASLARSVAGGSLRLATRWEAVITAVLPYARSGIIGAVILGLGRALGETMAVTMLIGNRHEIAASLFAPGYTMAAAIANEFSEAVGDMHLSALAYVALLLFVVTVLVNAGARLLIWRVARGSGIGSKAL